MKLAQNGHVYLATDSESYAHEILEYFNAEPLLQNKNREPGFIFCRDYLPKTKYEKSFIYAGDKIYYLEYSRLPADEQAKAASVKHENDGFEEADRKALSNDEMLIKKFKHAEAGAKDACDLKQLADQLACAGNKPWAEKVYKKAEDKAEDSLDLNWLAYSVCETLGDKDWLKNYMRRPKTRPKAVWT